MLIAHDKSPPAWATMPKLKMVLAGIQHVLAFSKQPRPRLPITPLILSQLRSLWLSRAHEYNIIMLWAVCCTCFFGFFRMGELTANRATEFDPMRHISISDIAVDVASKPSMIELMLKCSKTDQLGRGARIYLGRTNTELCPVTALLAYVGIRGIEPGPLFRLKNGTPLLKSFVVSSVREALHSLGYNQSCYAGHSFRIGAATTAAAVGIEDSTIQALGRWSSAAFKTYIRLPQQYLASLSKQMVSSQLEQK